MERHLILNNTSMMNHPCVAEMFRQRADQFSTRLKWPDLRVDNEGLERDSFDSLRNCQYAMITRRGRLLASARLLAMSGPTMVEKLFPGLFNFGMIDDRQKYWEVSRLCTAPGADSSAAIALLLFGWDFLNERSADGFIGVYEPHMRFVYREIGWVPRKLNRVDRLEVGLWEPTQTVRDAMVRKLERLR